MKTMTEAATFRAVEPNRCPKKSGMVALCRYCVISLVRRPRMRHANSEPISALPSPIHVADIPYFHPN